MIDGDTVELTDGRRIRYLEIDTPETVHPDKPVECFGPEATQRNRELIEGRDVELLPDGPDMDQFGRYLRYVFVEGMFVNAELVWEGYAVASSYGHQGRLFQTLVQLQRAAQEGNIDRSANDCCQIVAITRKETLSYECLFTMDLRLVIRLGLEPRTY